MGFWGWRPRHGGGGGRDGGRAGRREKVVGQGCRQGCRGEGHRRPALGLGEGMVNGQGWGEDDVDESVAAEVRGG